MNDKDLPLYDMSVYDQEICRLPLYEGSQVSLLEALIKHFSWFSEHPGIRKSALSDILYMQHNNILPRNNCLPESYEAALKKIEPFLIKPVEFHACPNDCHFSR